MHPFDLEEWLDSTRKSVPIVQAGDPVLRTRATEVPKAVLGTRAFDALIERMVVAMRAAPGVGLAGPQIGVPWRVFVAEDSEGTMARATPEARAVRARTTLPLVAVVNPVLTLRGPTGPQATPDAPGTATFFEGCLSVRGYGALVTRAFEVSLTGVDPHGRELTLECQGWPARILQHETDHLEGTLYVDRMLTRSLVGDAELPRWSGAPVDEALRAFGIWG